jgi:hypothetical protein
VTVITHQVRAKMSNQPQELEMLGSIETCIQVLACTVLPPLLCMHVLVHFHIKSKE